MKYDVGDEVKIIDSTSHNFPMNAIVVVAGCSEESRRIAVSKRGHYGHNCDGMCSDNNGQWVYDHQVMLYSRK